MDDILINRISFFTKNVPSAAKTNNVGSVSGLFASEMQTALSALFLQPLSDGAEEKQNAVSEVVAQIEKLVTVIEEQVQKTKETDSSEATQEIFAALQQLYVLLQQLQQITGQTQRRSDLLGVAQAEAAWKQFPNLIPFGSREKVQELSLMVQKTQNVLDGIGETKGNVLPPELITRLKAALLFLKEQSGEVATVRSGNMNGIGALNAGSDSGQKVASMLNAGSDSGQKVAGMLNAGSNSEQNVPGTGIQSEAGSGKRESGFALEEGTLTKAMHHQMQGTAAAGKAEASVVFSNRNAHVPLVPARFFANEMEVYIVKHMRLNQGTGAMETTLRLFPENLGRVDVKITALNGAITAQFTAATSAGKEAIEQQLHQLRQALIQQGLQVEKIEVNHVSVTSSESDNRTLDQEKEGGSGRQEHEQPKEETSDEAVFNLEELLEERAEMLTEA
ncbi:flagellar hook-length control protein FliK [Aneurinibacillus thermoaerophilus]|uniref:flagellar hook-length control protein FliK n=1 Tax=Aneurinibacillus thermoaerophilus TaxID=143495 RepID=UPI002E1E1BD2|nr:flagellar hook-length control protein FliK [Aneurinibacillus thermoaerophilus]